MALKCKAGDLAMIIRDDVGYEANLGRMVKVGGPLKRNGRGMATWLIEPTERRLWAVGLPGKKPKFEIVRFRDMVEHPDRWLLPIRPLPGEADETTTARPSPRKRRRVVVTPAAAEAPSDVGHFVESNLRFFGIQPSEE